MCGCTPSGAETTSTAASTAASTRSTSEAKSLCPGVSTRCTRWPRQGNWTAAEAIVMPRARSSGSESVAVVPPSTLPGARTRPQT